MTAGEPVKYGIYILKCADYESDFWRVVKNRPERSLKPRGWRRPAGVLAIKVFQYLAVSDTGWEDVCGEL